MTYNFNGRELTITAYRVGGEFNESHTNLKASKKYQINGNIVLCETYTTRELLYKSDNPNDEFARYCDDPRRMWMDIEHYIITIINANGDIESSEEYFLKNWANEYFKEIKLELCA